MELDKLYFNQPAFINMKNTDNQELSRHIEIIKGNKTVIPNGIQAGFPDSLPVNGLANLQKSTVSLMNSESRNWGFAGSQFKVKRQKLADDVWKITVENPKTREIVLEAEGHGDKVFAFEDNLARMAEALIEKDLKITTSIKHK